MFSSLAILALSRAWAKTHQIHRFAKFATTANTWKHLESGFVRVADETQPVHPGNAICEHHGYLAAIRCTRQRLAAATLVVTEHSKMLLTSLHRGLVENNPHALRKAQDDLDMLVDIHMNNLFGQLENLKGVDLWKFRGVYFRAMQDYVEATTFFFFCKNDIVPSLENLNVSLRPPRDLVVEPLKISQHDYVVGLVGLCERLLILADSLFKQGRLHFTERICCVVDEVYEELFWGTHELYELNMEIHSKRTATIQYLGTIENGYQRASTLPLALKLV